MVEPLIRNGWEIYFHSKLFATQRKDLQKRVQKLKTELATEDYIKHPDVKLLASVMIGIKERIILDPFDSQLSLKGLLKGYGRLKKGGLSDNRYRLFFKASKEEDRKVLIVIWLGYPRKEGASDDCYEVFTRMVKRGDFPNTLDEFLQQCD